MDLNKAILVGRLTRDPETRALASGQSVTKFGLATSRYYNKEGQRQEVTEFHNVVLFGKIADVATQYLNKGALVLIEGRIQTRTWQDNTGNKRWITEIIGERMQLGPKSGNKPAGSVDSQEDTKETNIEDIPVIEEDEEIDVKNIPF